MLTRRGRLALALGVGVYAAAWTFGSQALYPVAVGLVVAAIGARVWVGTLSGPVALRRRARGEHTEGENADVAVEIAVSGRIRPPAARLVEHVGRLGAIETVLRRRRGGVLGGGYRIGAVPRGRYRFDTASVVLEDPFGLARKEVTVDAPGALLVLPRITDLEGLFSESGAHATDGRRLLLRRPSGFDVHSVREYERGESLRKVHWRSTAHRGQLMVKDLEDAPRDEVAILLDAGGLVTGTPPESSFDLQVRAAGSILRAHTRRGRRAALVVTSTQLRRVGSSGDDWRDALELLAAAEPDATSDASAFVGDRAGAAAQALDLVVVTARLSGSLGHRLLRRASARQATSLVVVDPASFAPGATAAHSVAGDPLVLQLRAAGVAVAVLRRGDDLAVALGSAGASARAADA